MDSTVTHDPVAEAIGFTIRIAGKQVPCRVTAEWLHDTYGGAALDEGTMAAFTQRRPTIEATALRQWLASRGIEPVCLKRHQVWRQGGAERSLQAAGQTTG